MINATQLLADLKRRLTLLDDDLRQRINEVPELKESLQTEWQAARDAERTAETFESWADQVITQAGVHWLLSCVFLRFIEDNNLIDRPWIGGTPESGRLNLARDRHEAYFRANPLETDREYLLACFREAGTLPGLHTFFDEIHNPVFRLGISGDAAMALRSFWQQQDPNTGALLHDFTDDAWNTRFLGDLYQDLSEATRKRYALLQTPEFVEEFILDRTLTPAIREFSYREVRMIDPTCGSGHFLLGGFQRMVDEWSRAEPGRNRRDVAQKALDAVAGVDLNPFAVAISRFRLLVAALQASDVHRLSDAPDFQVSVAIGDSLLHGKRFGLKGTEDMFQQATDFAETGLGHAYASEDLAEVQQILGRQYHAVVGNPPYIVVKDAALNYAYRKQYASCRGKYSLGCPFTERFFELALTGGAGSSAGFVGLITADSFMKREFGSTLIEQVLPRIDLTHVISTAGAYIPGHGTPTLIFFGRHRAPVSDVVRTAMGIKGEPCTPDEPAHGLVWSAILKQIDYADSESEFISVVDMERSVLSKHPWSLGGGGAATLKEMIDEKGLTTLGKLADIGVGVVTLEDDAFYIPRDLVSRRKFSDDMIRGFVVGDIVRDWRLNADSVALFPHLPDTFEANISPEVYSWLWPLKTSLSNRLWFKKTQIERGYKWYAYGHISADKFRTPLTITIGEIATHNHFVLDRGGKVFSRTAPVVKLTSGPPEDEYLGLLGLLNSSVACFWLKQVCFPKGGDHVGGEGARVRKTMWDERYAFNSTNIADFPVLENRPIDLAKKLEIQAQQLAALLPAVQLASTDDGSQPVPTRASLDDASEKVARLRSSMIAGQEELDWHCYGLYGLLPINDDGFLFAHGNPPEIELGQRAFEIVLARRIAAGAEQSVWFERHGSTPITEIPSSWPEDYRRVVQNRIDLIASDRNIGIIERPEFKRRWSTPSWSSLEQLALRKWLLERLESPSYWSTTPDRPPLLTSTSRLADAVRQDSDFMHVAALYAGHADFELDQIVANLVVNEAVPFLPVFRYTDTGLRKRVLWEETWSFQRIEDAGEDLASTIGKISVPPKYQRKDFLKSEIWRLRGPLDVPKERWVSYPCCERGADGSLVIAWAGWNHLQQATALAAFYIDMKENEGWPVDRLQPLLAGLLELLPWLKQWHNDLNPDFGERMGNYYEGFVVEEARAIGVTKEALSAWVPM